MRELEFVPTWYAQASRCRRLVMLQAWLTMVIALALGLWMALVLRNIRRYKDVYDDLGRELAQSQVGLHQMEVLAAQRDALVQQQDVLGKLGMHVEVARVLRTLDVMMPRDMSLLNVQMEAEEMIDASNTGAVSAAAPGDAPVTRRLRVRIQGVAPSDLDVGNFEAELRTAAFFEDVAVTYARERGENGHVLREFEITFSVALHAPAV